jgi:hypothetical protein
LRWGEREKGVEKNKRGEEEYREEREREDDGEREGRQGGKERVRVEKVSKVGSHA